MDSPTVPQKNYVGLLGEKCAKNRINAPDFVEDSDQHIDKTFKCTCLLKGLTTEGTGYTKKIAKQNSAHAMLQKLEDENIFQNLGGGNSKSCSVSNLFEYSSQKRKDPPLFSEKPNEDGLYVVSCFFNEFTSTGKASSKKIAKEMSANLVVKHFKIDEYIHNMKKSKERTEIIKPPTQCLHEFCQYRGLKIEYTETNIGKSEFVVTCTVGKNEVSSASNPSKKQAKIEAASLMLNLLNNSTPEGSPVPSEGVLKRKLSENISSDEEPLFKRINE